MDEKELNLEIINMSGFKTLLKDKDLTKLKGCREYSIEIVPRFMYSNNQRPIGILMQIRYIAGQEELYRYAAIASFMIEDKGRVFGTGYSKESLKENPYVIVMLEATIGYIRSDIRTAEESGIPYLPLISAKALAGDLMVVEE